MHQSSLAMPSFAPVELTVLLVLLLNLENVFNAKVALRFWDRPHALQENMSLGI